MYVFEEYLRKHLIIKTKMFSFEGILVDHEIKDDIPCHWEEPLFCCLISTRDGMIEIPDKDIMDIQVETL